MLGTTMYGLLKVSLSEVWPKCWPQPVLTRLTTPMIDSALREPI